MQTKKITVLFTLILVPSVWLIAESSFTKKKSKLPSANTLKTDCGYKCADILEHLTDLQQEIAQLQRELLKKSRELIEGESDSFFNRSSKSELQVYLDSLSALDQKMLAFKKDIQESKKNIQ